MPTTARRSAESAKIQRRISQDPTPNRPQSNAESATIPPHPDPVALAHTPQGANHYGLPDYPLPAGYRRLYGPWMQHVSTGSSIDDAIAYIKRSYTSRRDPTGNILDLKSAFAYQPGAWPTYSTASEGLLALQVCGEYDAPELKSTVEWLRLNKLKNSSVGYFYYGTYYFAQGMYQRGGVIADEARQVVENLLLAEQKENGRWQGQGVEAVPVYSTAMAVLSLSVRHHFIPIYQR